MKRYTVGFRSGEPGAGLRAALARHLFGALPVYTLGADAEVAPDLWQVELGTDAGRPQTERVVEAFARQQGLRVQGVRWG